MLTNYIHVDSSQKNNKLMNEYELISNHGMVVLIEKMVVIMKHGQSMEIIGIL